MIAVCVEAFSLLAIFWTRQNEGERAALLRRCLELIATAPFGGLVVWCQTSHDLER